MDPEDLFAKKADDPLNALARQDLDPLSVHDLERRIAVLAAETDRTRRKIEAVVNHRATADALFRQ